MALLGTQDMVIDQRPTPNDFDVYLPWACKELRIGTNLVITKTQSLEKSNLPGAQLNKSLNHLKDEGIDSDNSKSIGMLMQTIRYENTVKINSVCDILGNIIQLKFDKNKKIPQQLLKLIGLILHFHKYISHVTLNSGLDNACLYELSKWLASTNITDICLDDAVIHDGMYDSLIQNKNNLKNLSMARCRIDDIIVKRIAMNLHHPLPASKTLRVLNMASNLITDMGAKYIAAALRTNRGLVYLNVADNKITDEGAIEMFDALTVFHVSDEEMLSFRLRYLEYIKERNSLMYQIAHELINADCDKRCLKMKRPIKPTPVHSNMLSKKGLDTEFKRKSFFDIDISWLEKAKIATNDRIGIFIDPFSSENVFFEDDKIHCYGNNNLAYINISYNDIGYITVKKILSVLLDQQNQIRTSKGLVNVSLEGNLIPSKCKELEKIDNILLSSAITARYTLRTRK